MAKGIIRVRDLVKVYGELRAVDGISFDVEEGEVFAFLGPNGAGKTTTVEMIETLRSPTSGTIDILDMESSRNRLDILGRVGILPQEFSSFDRLTVEETIRYYAALFSSDSDINELIKLVNLEPHRKQLYMNLSGGLKQRVGIAVSLINDPEIVFLDEPTTGLDPRARHDVWDVIRGLRNDGKTIFLTTHYMEEAEVLADHVAIISKGKIIARGTTNELIDNHFKKVNVTIMRADDSVCHIAEGMNMPVKSRENGNVTVEAQDNDQIVEFLVNLKSGGIHYTGMDIRKPNLEELFLALTGESLITDEPEEEP